MNFYHSVLFLSIVLSLSIFLLSFFTYPQLRNTRLLITGFAFLVSGLINTASFFSVLSRVSVPIGFLKVLITVISVIYAYNLIHSVADLKRTGDSVYKILACSFILLILSNISALGISTYGIAGANELLGALSQVFQAVAYVFFFYIFYIFMKTYLSKLDKLVDERTTELRNINEKLLADQEVARSMQLSMLPEALPVNDSVAFSSGYAPAENLSGDFYNVFKIDGQRFGICIGDVSGHGVPAAMLSIFTFQKLQSLMEEAGGEGMTIPSQVLRHLYDSLNSANFSEDMYIVMLYGVYNTMTGIFSYASGGLNTTPLRVRPDGSIQELDNDGYAICKLGDLLKPKFVNHQILLFPGDKLVLYTDGMIDARNNDNEQYSLSRLKSTILKNYKWGVDHLSEAIMRDVKSYTDDKPEDDITLLIIDVLPPYL